MALNQNNANVLSAILNIKRNLNESRVVKTLIRFFKIFTPKLVILLLTLSVFRES